MVPISKTLELFDLDKIKLAITPACLSRLARIDIFNTIASTNTYLLDQVKKNPASGWICVAEQQSKGRGRQGRTWFSPRSGNIYFSMLWQFHEHKYDLSGLSLAVAVMLIHALRRYGVTADIQLKWPNDIWIDGRKLAGILLERKETNVVVGIGLNVVLPEGSDPAWVGLQEVLTETLDRNAVVGVLIDELLMQFPRYEQQGLAAFIEEWRQHDVLFGKEVMIEMPTQRVAGVASGINAVGELLLKDDRGQLLQFGYGEVSVKTF